MQAGRPAGGRRRPIKRLLLARYRTASADRRKCGSRAIVPLSPFVFGRSISKGNPFSFHRRSPLIKPRRRVPPFLPHDGGEAASVLGATILFLPEIRFFTLPFGEWKAKSSTLKRLRHYTKSTVHSFFISNFKSFRRFCLSLMLNTTSCDNWSCCLPGCLLILLSCQVARPESN